MTPGLPSPSPPRWYQFTSADAVFLCLALLVVQAARLRGMIDDPGLGWHLRNIDAMIVEGGWLTQDPFTGPRLGQPYRTNQWLGEVPLWLGEKWAGLEGIAIVSAIVIALTLSCMYRMLLSDGLPWPIAVSWVALAALGTACSWVSRPNLFTMLFVLLTARVLEQFHTGKLSGKATLWLLPLFAVWANMHGGFIAGFILLGTALAVEIAIAVGAAAGEGRGAARGRATHLFLLSLGAFASTLLNPYGWRLYPWILKLLGNPYFMELNDEWHSPDFHRAGSFPFELVILLFPAVLAVSNRRPTLVELGFALVWFHLALNGFRYVPLFVLLVVPMLARCSVEVPWLQDLARRWELTAEKSPLFASRPGRLPWLWTAVAAVLLFAGARLGEGQFARHNPKYIPTAILDQLLELHREYPEPPPVLHSYNWGGYLTWKGWPRFKNWIDDRNEVQGEPHTKDYFAIVDAEVGKDYSERKTAEPEWEKKLRNAGIQIICLPPHLPVVAHLRRSRDWRLVAEDKYGIIFEREAGEGIAFLHR
jgi:hypothetical protein